MKPKSQKEKSRSVSLIFLVPETDQPLIDLENIACQFEKNNRDLEIIGLYEKESKKIFNQAPGAKIKFSPYPLKRLGKGFAFCYGFNQSSGDDVFFWEGNFPISTKLLFLYLNLMAVTEADIVIGSKRHSLSSVEYPYFRRFFSLIYQLLIKIIFGLNLTDTQVGLKLYRRSVLKKVIPKIIVKGWAFELEILIVSSLLGFKRIIEAPIEISGPFAKKLPRFSDIHRALVDTLAIFYRKNIIGYYDQKEK